MDDAVPAYNVPVPLDMEVVVPLAYMLLGLVDTVLAQTYLDMAWLVDQDNMDLDKGYIQAHMGYRLDSFVADMETLADIDLLYQLVLFELAVLALIMASLVLLFGILALVMLCWCFFW